MQCSRKIGKIPLFGIGFVHIVVNQWRSREVGANQTDWGVLNCIDSMDEVP